MFKREHTIRDYFYDIKLIASLIFIGWIAVIIGFLGWEIRNQRRSAIEFARIEAIASYNKDLVYRRWATLHGGVYVPRTQKTPSSPYLINVKEREIQTPSGKTLTLVNPAYMTRQVHELAQEQYFVKGHITSLNLIRPQNKPDEWEKKALQSFNTGVKEVCSVSSIQGEPFLRFMRPMFVEKGCLKCHGYQGYKVGDVRGGVSVSVPMDPYNAIASDNIKASIFVHGTILLLGLAGLGMAFFSIRKNNRERRNAEERLNLAVSATRDGIWDWNIETNETVFAARWCQIMGYSEDDPELPHSFDSWTSRIHPDDYERVMAAIKAHLTENKSYDVKYRHKHSSGEYRWQQSRGKAVFDKSGKAVRMVGSISDIHDEVLTIEKLKESEEKFRLVFHTSPDSINLNRLEDGMYLEINQGFTQIMGYNREDVLGKTSHDLNIWKHSRDRKRLVQGLKESGYVENLEAEFLGKDGRIRDGLMSARILTINNETVIISITRDNTERKTAERALKASEEQHRSILETAMEGFWLTDMKGNLLEVNQTYCLMSGYSQEELLGMNISNLEAKESGKEIIEHLNALIVNEQDRFESRHRRKDGSVFDVEASVQYKQNDGGRCICFIRDITEQKRFAEQLQQAQKMESIGNLAGGIAHDFNNLLFPVVGIAEMLVEDLPAGSVEQENANEILQAGKRGAELVKQILSFSRQHEHTFAPTRLQFVMKEVLKLARSSIPTNIEIQQSLKANCGMVLADSTQLHQIGMNLITNAYHAVQDKGGKIRIEVKEVEIKEELSDLNLFPGKYATLAVSDNGTGIPKEHLDKIFEPYFTTKEKGKGTGLGLSVVYGIVKEHQGEIAVTSEPGKGTLFQIYFPVMALSDSGEPVVETSLLQKGVENILLVDDELPIANLEKKILERLGYQVSKRTNALDALEAFRFNPGAYDLLISDMSMPQMTGDQLAKEILKIRPDMPIIICTGFSERVSKEAVEKMGIKCFLMKPVVRAELAKMVRKVLDDAKGPGQG